MIKEDILKYIKKHKKVMRKDIVRTFIKKSSLVNITYILTELREKGIIKTNRKGREVEIIYNRKV